MRQWSNWGFSRPRLPIPVGVFVRACLVALPFPFLLEARSGISGGIPRYGDAGSELTAGFGDFARFRASAHGVGSLGFGWACLGLIGSLSNPDCYDIFESAPSLIFHLSGSPVMDHKVMRLFIGKNHDEKVASAPVQSIFRLTGNNEDALTYALGFLIAREPALCVELVSLCGVKPSRAFKDQYTIRLQEVTDSKFGRRDIVIEAAKVRIVIEAKIGKAEPDATQLLKYADDAAKWKNFQTRVVASLTAGELSPSTVDEVASKLPRRPKIRFAAIQWHQVIDLVLRHKPSDGSEISRYLFEEFIRYIREDYDMGYYDAEIKIQDTNPGNARVFEEGWMQLTSYRTRAPLYVAPYFTGRGGGISKIARVVGVASINLAVAAGTYEPATREAVTEDQRQHWSRGLRILRELYPESTEQMILFLDKPMPFKSPPLTKKAFNDARPSAESKQIPQQIPQGFHLRFDELMRTGYLG